MVSATTVSKPIQTHSACHFAFTLTIQLCNSVTHEICFVKYFRTNFLKYFQKILQGYVMTNKSGIAYACKSIHAKQNTHFRRLTFERVQTKYGKYWKRGRFAKQSSANAPFLLPFVVLSKQFGWVLRRVLVGERSEPLVIYKHPPQCQVVSWLIFKSIYGTIIL